MTQCVRITLVIPANDDLVHNFIQKNAQKLLLEGISNIEAQDTIKIIASGRHTAIDEFIDLLYNGYKGLKPTIVEVEPYITDRNYRGIFRVI